MSRRYQRAETARHLFFAAVAGGAAAANIMLMIDPVPWLRVNLGWHWVLEVVFIAVALVQVSAVFDALGDEGVLEDEEDDGITCDCPPELRAVPDEEGLWVSTCGRCRS